MPTARITHEVLSPQKRNVMPMARPAGKKFGRGSVSCGNGSHPWGTAVWVSFVIKASPSPAGHPHEQASNLLVLFRSDTPARLNQVQDAEAISVRLSVNRTHTHRREGDENSENTARDAGAEKIKHRARRGHPLLLTGRKNLSPENRA